MRAAAGAVTRARKAGVSRRRGTRAAGGVVVARAASTGADRTLRRACCLSVREGVGVGKGGAVSLGTGLPASSGPGSSSWKGCPHGTVS